MNRQESEERLMTIDRDLLVTATGGEMGLAQREALLESARARLDSAEREWDSRRQQKRERERGCCCDGPRKRATGEPL